MTGFALGTGGVVIAAVAMMQVVQTYRYDANGRLVEVVRSQSGTNGTTAYSLDDADNRVSVTRTESSGLLADRSGGETISPEPLASPTSSVARAEVGTPRQSASTGRVAASRPAVR